MVCCVSYWNDLFRASQTYEDFKLRHYHLPPFIDLPRKIFYGVRSNRDNEPLNFYAC